MQTIVITGSTRGIGRGLAKAFLERGHQVVVSGRTQEAVDQTVRGLSAEVSGAADRVAGQTADVARPEDLQRLWDAAVARFGRVDIWINNAAVASDHIMLADVPYEQVVQTIQTNLVGTIMGIQVPLQGMRRQGRGQIYTFEGFGSDGMTAPGMGIYGCTKYAIRYITQTAAKEVEGTGVLVGTLSPGMVPTDLLIYSSRGDDPAKWEKSRRIMNTLGDTVETVAPWLAEQALANTRNGARFAWLTRGKALWRFMHPKYRKRRLIEEFEAAYTGKVR